MSDVVIAYTANYCPTHGEVGDGHNNECLMAEATRRTLYKVTDVHELAELLCTADMNTISPYDDPCPDTWYTADHFEKLLAKVGLG